MYISQITINCKMYYKVTLPIPTLGNATIYEIEEGDIHLLGLGNFIQGRFDKYLYFLNKHLYLHYSLHYFIPTLNLFVLKAVYTT